MPSPALKRISIRHENTQTASLVVWKEVETGDGGGKVTQERMEDYDAAKVTAKKEANNCQMQTKTRLTKKRVGKTMHFCDRYATQCLFETSGQPGSW